LKVMNNKLHKTYKNKQEIQKNQNLQQNGLKSRYQWIW